MKDIAIYVSLFAIGHSLTMITGVMLNFGINAYIIDAIIGFSIVYKALDNLGAYQRWFGFQPNTKIATLVFGLFHGFGLASKVIDYEIAEDGLLPNLIAFNVGVELGQITLVLVVFSLLVYLLKSKTYYRSYVTIPGSSIIGLFGVWWFIERTLLT